MRTLPWHLSARRSTDDPAVEKKLFGLPLRDICNYAAFCAAHGLPRNPASFDAWEAQRLPARSRGARSLQGTAA
ncbi:MAG: hypothetical protein J0H53_17625 [Rhizobiales bacterium]|nr:hypothetical protein [Hyphomicrobiales bacterium]